MLNSINLGAEHHPRATFAFAFSSQPFWQPQFSLQSDYGGVVFAPGIGRFVGCGMVFAIPLSFPDWPGDLCPLYVQTF